MVNLTTADVQDAAGLGRSPKAIHRRWPWRKHLFADTGYGRRKLMGGAAYHDFVIGVLRKLAGQQGFQILRRRWVVERTSGWMKRWCRLVRDHEPHCNVFPKP
jgi:transposase